MMSDMLTLLLKAKFHYASWFGAGPKPNAITLSGSNQLRTSSDPASVMEFGFNETIGLLIFTSRLYM